MAKETASYISQLVATNPVASDSVSVGDDHLRMLKTVLKTQFSGLSGTTAVTASEAEMNYLDIATLGTSADSKVLTQASGVVTIAGDVVVSGTTPKITIGDAGAEDASIVFDGNAQDFYIGLDDSADDLVIGLGSTLGTTPAMSIDANQVVTFHQDPIFGGTTPKLTLGDAGAEDTMLAFDGNAVDFHISLDDSADDLVIGTGTTAGTATAIMVDGGGTLATTFYGDVTMGGTTPTLTIGDAGAEDTKIVFDGNAKDFYVALDDSADKLLIGEGSTVGTNPILTITDDTVTLGDGAAVDTAIVFDGNAKDFYVALDDSADKLLIGEGSTVGTNPILSITDDTVTLGDGAAVDTAIVFDGNAKDFHIALDDSADKLIIGEGSTVGTNEILSITDDTVTIGDGAAVDTYLNFDGNAADFRIGIDDGTDKLEIGGGVAHGTAAGISMDVNGDMTLGGGIVCSDEVISRPELKDYAESYTATSGSGTVDLDLTDGNVFQHTASGGNVTFTFSNPPGSGKGGSFTLKWIQDSSNRTITWPGAVDWAGGSAPSVTSGSAKVDVYTFFTVDGGTIWYGFQPGADLG
mgnify:CR=1 FL=1